MKVGGSGSKRAMDGLTVGKEKVRAKYVINCAGGTRTEEIRDSFAVAHTQVC